MMNMMRWFLKTGTSSLTRRVGWTAAARSYWSNKPSIIISDDEIEDGGSVKITCTQAIDYSGGECRLYREHAAVPFRETKEAGFLCVFLLSSDELLGRGHPVGSRVYFTCDYHLQQYTSVKSDVGGVTVWGSSPGPRMSVSHRFLSPEDSVEVTCSPPRPPASSCYFYRDQVIVARGSCSRNLTGLQLGVWKKPAPLLPVNLTCRYYPRHDLQIRSELSNHQQLFVLDVGRVSASVNCSVSVEDDQLEAFRDSWTSVGADGRTLTVQVTRGNLTVDQTCDYIQA
ncbi:uncharacterized protein [Labrus bergylta]|uniref:uncharacterized protein isoform X1 n=1 Tax=Labrus bergylta TaxID=56723 RepID=UPI00331386DA